MRDDQLGCAARLGGNAPRERAMRRHKVRRSWNVTSARFAVVALDSAAARWAMRRYFQELDARFSRSFVTDDAFEGAAAPDKRQDCSIDNDRRRT